METDPLPADAAKAFVETCLSDGVFTLGVERLVPGRQGPVLDPFAILDLSDMPRHQPERAAAEAIAFIVRHTAPGMLFLVTYEDEPRTARRISPGVTPK